MLEISEDGALSFTDVPVGVLDPPNDLSGVETSELVDVEGQWRVEDDDGSGRLTLRITVPATAVFPGGEFLVFLRTSSDHEEIVRYLDNDNDVEFVLTRTD